MARYQLPDEGVPHSPDITQLDPIMERAMDELNARAASIHSGSIDFAMLGHPNLAQEYSAPEMQQRIDFMQLQARVRHDKENFFSSHTMTLYIFILKC